MEYRKLPKGEERISILGMGTSSIGASGEKEAQEVMALALEQGINYFDLASADAVPFPAFGKEIAGCRKDVHFQIHFGADYHTGTYGWTTNLDTIRKSIDWQLNALKITESWRKRRTTVSAAVIVKNGVHSMLVRSAAWMRSQITSTNNYSPKQSITV